MKGDGVFRWRGLIHGIGRIMKSQCDQEGSAFDHNMIGDGEAVPRNSFFSKRGLFDEGDLIRRDRGSRLHRYEHRLVIGGSHLWIHVVRGEEREWEGEVAWSERGMCSIINNARRRNLQRGVPCRLPSAHFGTELEEFQVITNSGTIRR